MIYFVQAVGGQGPIKIGFARTWLENRLAMLQRCSPVRLVALAVLPDGDMAAEQAIHARCNEHRRYGEWFAPTAEVLALVAAARLSTPAAWLDYQTPMNAPRRGNWNPGARYRRAGGAT